MRQRGVISEVDPPRLADVCGLGNNEGSRVPPRLLTKQRLRWCCHKLMGRQGVLGGVGVGRGDRELGRCGHVALEMPCA